MFCLLHRRFSIVTNLVFCIDFATLDSHFLLLLLHTQSLRPFQLQQQQHQKIVHHQTSPPSFTVSYLINSCSLSPESALSASNKVRFKSASKPDLVLHLFRNHGFSNTQIANLITKRPSLLLAKPHKTLLPKLEFLKQIGFSEDGIADFLSKDPTFMLRSLERKIKPSCEYLKSLLGTNQKVVAAIKNSRTTWIFQFDLERIISHKVEILRKYGVTEGNIVKLVTARTRSLGNKDDKFEELVRNVSEMGFDPSSSQFVHAIDVLAGMKSDTLEAKLQLIANHGWSPCEIALAIRNQPVLVALSEEKLKKGLDFFMNKLKWEPSKLVNDANLLGLSLEKRVIPRWMVIQCLLSKCLIKDNVSVCNVIKLTEAKFLEKQIMEFEGFSS